jgi:hypothetical protein
MRFSYEVVIAYQPEWSLRAVVIIDAVLAQPTSEWRDSNGGQVRAWLEGQSPSAINAIILAVRSSIDTVQIF